MAIRKIIKDSDPQLRKKSRPVEKFDEKLGMLLDDLKETLTNRGGVGLAAPQVSILRRVFIIQDGEYYLECVNPEIILAEGFQEGYEGCLSVDNREELIQRPYKLDVKFFDRHGKENKIQLEGFHAVIFCHERDHLDGILFYDHLGEVIEEK